MCKRTSQFFFTCAASWSRKDTGLHHNQKYKESEMQNKQLSGWTQGYWNQNSGSTIRLLRANVTLFPLNKVLLRVLSTNKAPFPLKNLRNLEKFKMEGRKELGGKECEPRPQDPLQRWPPLAPAAQGPGHSDRACYEAFIPAAAQTHILFPPQIRRYSNLLIFSGRFSTQSRCSVNIVKQVSTTDNAEIT